jgi:hypothetical protein
MLAQNGKEELAMAAREAWARSVPVQSTVKEEGLAIEAKNVFIEGGGREKDADGSNVEREESNSGN